MLVVSITQKSLDHYREMIGIADGVEFRLDQMKIDDLPKSCPIPTILTIRSKKEGGSFEGDYEKAIEDLFKLKPEYIDIEWRADPAFVHRMRCEYPQQKIICSYHDYEKTDFEAIEKARKAFDADLFKVATWANSALDSLKMLEYVKAHPGTAGMCMGDHGLITRILSPIFESALTIACVDDMLGTAPGQVSIHKLLHRYRYRQLTKRSKIYALLGHPVEQSFSHITHNRVFDEFHLDAVYVKIDLLVEEIEEFWKLAQKMPFEGFSVTIPHKRKGMELASELTERARAIGAVNTLIRESGKWTGVNADAPGALDAIERVETVKGKRFAILGAGGTARALAFEAKERGADVLIVARNREKGRAIGDFEVVTFEEFDGSYDIIANTTPVGMMPEVDKMPLRRDQIRRGCVVFDAIFNPVQTKLLEEAKNAGAKVVPGIEMYLGQAAIQFKRWFPQLNIQSVRNTLQSAL